MTNKEAKSEARDLIRDAFDKITADLDKGHYPDNPYMLITPKNAERVKEHIQAYSRKLQLGIKSS